MKSKSESKHKYTFTTHASPLKDVNFCKDNPI